MSADTTETAYQCRHSVSGSAQWRDAINFTIIRLSDVPVCTGEIQTQRYLSSAMSEDSSAATCCQVCGNTTASMYFGALVCVPCKVCQCELSIWNILHCGCLLLLQTD